MLLEVEDLRVAYGPIEAVRGVTIAVERGEIVTVLGANGAGKSTLLGAIVGLVRAQRGQIRLDGRPIQDLAPEARVRLGVSLTPEGRRVFKRLSVADNLRLGGTIQRDRKSFDASWKRVLRLFPILEERLGQEAGSLSGGQQQMLAIGRSLMADPTLLLLDEPSLGLAPIIVEQVFELLEQLRDEGMTLLVVEQNVGRALALADRGYVLETGRQIAEGQAAGLLAAGDIERAYLGMSSTEAGS